MTLKGRTQLPRQRLEQLALLMHLHLETHPNRIGRKWGVSGNYIRQLWREASSTQLKRAEIEQAIRDYFDPTPDPK